MRHLVAICPHHRRLIVFRDWQKLYFVPSWWLRIVHGGNLLTTSTLGHSCKMSLPVLFSETSNSGGAKASGPQSHPSTPSKNSSVIQTFCLLYLVISFRQKSLTWLSSLPNWIMWKGVISPPCPPPPLHCKAWRKVSFLVEKSDCCLVVALKEGEYPSFENSWFIDLL